MFSEKICPKPTQKKQSQDKGNQAKTVENIKYDGSLISFLKAYHQIIIMIQNWWSLSKIDL